MLLSAFKSNQKLVSALGMLLLTILWAPSLFIDITYSSGDNWHLLQSINASWLRIPISIVLIGAQGIYLTHIVNENKLLRKKFKVILAVFFLLNSYNLTVLSLNVVLLSNTFILLAFHQLVKLYNLNTAYAISFNVGFWVSLATLLYFPSILVFPILWIGLIYMKPPVWRDFIISIFGFLTPLLFVIGYFFVFDKIDEGYAYSIYHLTPKKHFRPANSIPIYFTTIGIIALLSFWALMNSINESIVRIKKTLLITLLMLVVLTTTFFFNGNDLFGTSIIISIPLTIMVANFFQNIQKNWLAELLFLIVLLSLALDYFL